MRYKRVYVNGYDYFITVVTYERNPILVDNVALLRESFRYAKTKFDFTIVAIVILPDHFHMILHLDEAEEYSKIVSVIKRYFSKQCDEKYYAHIVQSESRNRQGYKPVWQKRFYEHTIRDEKEYQTRLDYIHFNAVKHGYATMAKAWEYSSFGTFVKQGIYEEDWCNFDSTLDLE